MSQQTIKTSELKESWQILGLDAKGPFPGLEEKLALFGQFVGDWDILEDRYLKEDGTWEVERGAIHWRWILEGRGMQDTFTSIDEKTGKETPWGTTVRFYDPKIDAWRSTWNSPQQGAVKTFIGRKIGDEIVLERKTEEGFLWHWVFYEIMSDSFRWRAEESRDDGKSWMIKEQMRVRRQQGVGSSRLIARP